MNKRTVPDLQPVAAGRLCFRLLDVRIVKDAPQHERRERAFIESNAHLLLLSNSPGSRIVVDGEPCVLRPGSLLVCAPGQLVEWTNYSGHPLELLVLYFQVFASPENDTAAATRLLPALFPFRGEAKAPSALTVGQLMDAIVADWAQGASSARLRCEAGLLELLAIALGYQEQKTEMALEVARSELERHYREEVTVDSLARIAGLSRYHFMRLFKERYGLGVMEYRTRLRLKEAKRLMSGTSLTLAEIVERIGYSSESYFSSLFKKEIGFAPAVYQRNQRLKIAAYSWVNIGQLLALRTIPFAAPMDQYWTDFYRNKYGDEVEAQLSHQYDFNLNVLRSVRPDRIVGMDGLVPPEEQLRLREVAPCLFLDWEDGWRSHLTAAARFLGREEDAQLWLARYSRKATAVREQLYPMIGDRLLVVVIHRERISVWGRRAATVFYDDLGFAAPSRIDGIDWLEPIDPAWLAGADADRLLVHLTDRSPQSEAGWSMLIQSEAWKKLPAVQEGRVHLSSGMGSLGTPWNDYSADSFGRFLNGLPRMFGNEKSVDIGY